MIVKYVGQYPRKKDGGELQGGPMPASIHREDAFTQ